VWAATRPADTSSSATVADLGQRLFFDKALSADRSVSCATCHQPRHAFADDQIVPTGVLGRKGTRNAPSLAALAINGPFFWDGRRDSLQDAAVDPMLHPQEMGLADDQALQSHLSTPQYIRAFSDAFGGGEVKAPTKEQVAVALAAYLRQLPRPASAFDTFYDGHDDSALSRTAKDGLRIFRGKAGCESCHRMEGVPIHFSDNQFHTTGTGLQTLGDMLPLLTADVAGQSKDPAAVGRLVAVRKDLAATGRFVVTHSPADIGLFRTPSLRYVAQTAPYMHDGSVATLEEAVDQEIYWRSLSSGQPVSLTVPERQALIAFLRSLSPPVPAPVHAPTS